MMNKLALATAPTITQDTLAERFQRYIGKGWTPALAAERAVRDLCDEGHGDALIADVLPSLLFERWQATQRTKSPVTERDVARLEGGTRERRRVDLDVLKRASSIMESLFEVDGAWVRIGDMDRASCRRASVQQKQAALKRAHYARFFHALGDRMSDGTSVRQQLQEAELAEIFEAATLGKGG